LDGLTDEPSELDQELAKLDRWGREKYQLNILLASLRPSIQEQEKLMADHKGPQTLEIIKLQSNTSKTLTQAKAHWKCMQEELLKPHKLSVQELEVRRAQTALLGQEILTLTKKNGGEGDLELESRVPTRTEAQRDMYTFAKAKRAARKHKREEAELVEVKTYEAVPPSEAETQFYDLVTAQREEQDEILEEIAVGLDRLHGIAVDLGDGEAAIATKIQTLDKSMDHSLFEVENADNRVQAILENSGGMSRWCPLIICVILILALAAYLANLS